MITNLEVVSEQTNEEKPNISENDKENKWCWVRIQEAIQRNKGDRRKCTREVLQIVAETCKSS